jgi:hypothetical protein
VGVEHRQGRIVLADQQTHERGVHSLQGGPARTVPRGEERVAHRLDRLRDVATQQVDEAHQPVDQPGGTFRDRAEPLRAGTQEGGIRRVARAPGGLGEDRDGKVRFGHEHRGRGL